MGACSHPKLRAEARVGTGPEAIASSIFCPHCGARWSAPGGLALNGAKTGENFVELPRLFPEHGKGPSPAMRSLGGKKSWETRRRNNARQAARQAEREKIAKTIEKYAGPKIEDHPSIVKKCGE